MNKIELIQERAQLVLEIQDIKQQLRDFPARNDWFHRTDAALRHKQRQYQQIELELAKLKQEDMGRADATFGVLLSVAVAADALPEHSDDLAKALDALDIVLPAWKEKHAALRGA